MKPILLFIGMLILSGFQPVTGQRIIAGLTFGPNIVYVDAADVQLTCNNLNTQTSYSLDIEQDGTNDMDFQASYFYFSHLMMEGTQTNIVPGSQIQFSCEISNENCLKKHLGGDTIDEKLNWVPQQEQAIFNNCTNSGNTECFTNEGYVGFRICTTDTVYGWIRCSATGTYTSAQLDIYDYAFAGTNGLKEDDNLHLLLCSNPQSNDLLIRIPEMNYNAEWKCLIYDISARILMEKELLIGENHVNITAFRSGMYMVVFYDRSGKKNVFKIFRN